jgi:hypothetical protein
MFMPSIGAALPAIPIQTLHDNQARLENVSTAYKEYVDNEPVAAYGLKPHLPLREQISLENLSQRYGLNPNPAHDHAVDRMQVNGRGIGAHYSANQKLTKNAGGTTGPGSWQRTQLHKKWGIVLREKYHTEVHALINNIISQLENGTFNLANVDNGTIDRLRKYQLALIPSQQLSNANWSSRLDFSGLDATLPGSRAVKGIGQELQKAVTHTDAKLYSWIGLFLNQAKNLPPESQMIEIKRGILDYQGARKNELAILATYEEVKRQAVENRKERLLPFAVDETYVSASQTLQQRLAPYTPARLALFTLQPRPVNNNQAG